MTTAVAAPPRSKLPVVLAGFCAFLSVFATQPLLPEFIRIFEASKVAVSLTVTAATLGVALAAPFIGTVADRLGRKRVIVWSAWLLAVTTMAAATANSLNTLIFWRLLEGLVTPGVFAITVAYIQEEWAGAGTGSATAAYVSGTVLGGFASRLISGMVAAQFGWQMSFLALGGVGLIGAAMLARYLPKETRFVRREQGTSLLSVAVDHLKNRQLLGTYVAGFCVLFSLLGAFTFITFYLAAPPFSLSSGAIGSLFVVYLFGAIITPNAGKVIDRYGQKITMAMAIACCTAGLLLTLSHSLPVVVTGLALACSGVFVGQSCSSSYIGLVAKHNKALAVGLYVTFYYVGGSFGSSVPGYLWAWGGWPACVALFTGVQLITGLITWNLWQR
ncbi:MAG: MFS transporter [Bryobacteraceae bacterium]|nr:MFS transporter [Bryobacteraceae bacterium]